MEQEPILRELTIDELELARRWQVYPEVVRFWVDECGLNADTETAAEWASQNDHMDLIMEAKRKYFEDSVFPRKLRPVLPETSA